MEDNKIKMKTKEELKAEQGNKTPENDGGKQNDTTEEKWTFLDYLKHPFKGAKKINKEHPKAKWVVIALLAAPAAAAAAVAAFGLPGSKSDDNNDENYEEETEPEEEETVEE